MVFWCWLLANVRSRRTCFCAGTKTRKFHASLPSLDAKMLQQYVCPVIPCTAAPLLAVDHAMDANSLAVFRAKGGEMRVQHVPARDWVNEPRPTLGERISTHGFLKLPLFQRSSPPRKQSEVEKDFFIFKNETNQTNVTAVFDILNKLNGGQPTLSP